MSHTRRIISQPSPIHPSPSQSVGIHAMIISPQKMPIHPSVHPCTFLKPCSRRNQHPSQQPVHLIHTSIHRSQNVCQLMIPSYLAKSTKKKKTCPSIPLLPPMPQEKESTKAQENSIVPHQHPQLGMLRHFIVSRVCAHPSLARKQKDHHARIARRKGV